MWSLPETCFCLILEHELYHSVATTLKQETRLFSLHGVHPNGPLGNQPLYNDVTIPQHSLFLLPRELWNYLQKLCDKSLGKAVLFHDTCPLSFQYSLYIGLFS